ncbi:MAG TPA: hypothetical protein PLZ51_11225 [Aggregatilineales bacterium]|nr:hypothetical protein [Aggregatilineales bacterium]
MTRQKWMTLLIILVFSFMIATMPVLGAEEPVAETATTEEAVNYGPGIALIFLITGFTGVMAVGGVKWLTEMTERKNKKVA